MSGGSFTVLCHTLVVAVVRVSHVEDGELGPPGQWVHGGRGRLVLAAVRDRAGRSNLRPVEKIHVLSVTHFLLKTSVLLLYGIKVTLNKVFYTRRRIKRNVD